ncbi:conserved hypothetical protein [Ricinus communis]|uniref:Uncharacterized protein n=1 Tax=Ricinus communis TaxID=3988 RepID=B9S0W3_RICCO|nr:conserved hypothetical protein [Ricinus communis]
MEGKEFIGISWSKFCANKDEGGMGFRDLQDFNLALLAKQGWKFIVIPHTLVARIYKAKYFLKECLKALRTQLQLVVIGKLKMANLLTFGGKLSSKAIGFAFGSFSILAF